MRNEEYFDKAISLLHKMGIKNEEIIVTGSIALDILGVLPESHKIHDFDCIVKIDQEKEKQIRWMSKILPSKHTTSDYTSVIFDINDITFNIWFNQNEASDITYKGIGVKKMLSILEKKKEYGRDKDYKDINEIAVAVLK